MSPPIAIIGAGPCGLTLARLLDRSKIDYILYERDPATAPAQQRRAGVGGSLDLHPGTGLKALEAAGLLEEFRRHARYDATQFRVATQQAEIKLSVGEGRDAPEIDRHQLRQMLLDSVRAENIQWGHGVKNVQRQDDGCWSIAFVNGEHAEGFQLVIGADGAWSKVTASKPSYSGAHFIEGRISPSNPSYSAAFDLVGKGNFAAVGSRKWLSVQQMADSSYRVYMGVRVPEDFARKIDLASATDAVRRDLLANDEYFAGWSPTLKRFIADAEGPFKPWPLYSLPVDATGWPRVPGVTLLGDAAHLTTPNGEGVNAAMYDSLILADKVVQHCRAGVVHREGLERAVAEYEEDMFPRAKEHIEDGNGMLQMMFAENAVEMWVQTFGGVGGVGAAEG